MLTKCVVSKGTTNSRKPKMRSDKAVILLKLARKSFSFPYVSGKLMHHCPKYISRLCFNLSVVLKLFLI